MVDMVLRKDQLEASLHEEKKLIEDGRLKEDSPLDLSESFRRLCEACRRGDLKICQEMITEGANINARDQFDYTPLILVSTFDPPLNTPGLQVALVTEIGFTRLACVVTSKSCNCCWSPARCVNVIPSKGSGVSTMR